jgi:hypothetical protein
MEIRRPVLESVSQVAIKVSGHDTKHAWIAHLPDTMEPLYLYQTR